MIQERQTINISGQDDLFSNLLKANDEDASGVNLDIDELISNIYVFLVAGIEVGAPSWNVNKIYNLRDRQTAMPYVSHSVSWLYILRNKRNYTSILVQFFLMDASLYALRVLPD